MNYWIVKGDKQQNNWDAIQPDDPPDRWRTSWPEADMQAMDRLFCWESDPGLRIVGLAEVVNPNVGRNAAKQAQFDVVYRTRALSAKPTKAEICQIPIIQNAKFLNPGIPRVLYRLSVPEAELLLQLIYAKNPDLPIIWPDVSSAGADLPVSDVEADEWSSEGKVLFKIHLIRERDRKLVESKKKSVLKVTGKLECEACGFDFEAVYGSIGKDFCEVHHRAPLSLNNGETKTRMKDLAILCSNCHRMVHRGRLLQVDELRRLIDSSRA